MSMSGWVALHAATEITRPAQIWDVPDTEKSVAHPLRIEGRVSYFDPLWKMVWLENDGVSVYVLLSTNAPPLRTGDRVRIAGRLVPEQGLAADRVEVTVLETAVAASVADATGRIGDRTAFDRRIVRAEGYVDAQEYVDDDHVRLELIVDDRPVIGWVKPDDPRRIPDWAGRFVRVQGLYSARFDPTYTETTIELWAGPEANVVALDALADSPRFALPRTPIDQLHRLTAGTPVLVRGSVEAHEAGTSITIRDATGQVRVESLQRERIPFGAVVEAAGEIAIDGARWVLRSALYRKIPDAPAHPAAPPAVLEHVDQIRELSLEEAARGRPVRIAGLVTWSLPGTDFFFLQDVSGGIRVRHEASVLATPQLGKYLEVEGVTFDHGTVAAVQLQRVVDRGSMSPPAPRRVTFDQAVTGQEDGQWVEMRGFLQRTESEGDWRWIHVTTPAGEFVGHLQSPVNFVANPGSLIRVQGVCETKPDADRPAGVTLRVPFLHSISIEEDAPVDYFDLPQRPVKSLRRLSGLRDMTRVRVAGTVAHAAPGRAVYVEEGDAGLMLLTRATGPLRPGDTIDAVGILGWEGARIVLREAVYRRTGGGAALQPVAVADPARPQPALDSRLVRLRGVLHDVARQNDRMRYTLQAGPALFEAFLDGRGNGADDPPVGAGLELTGIYQLGFDDSRQTRGFALQLRTPEDLAVYAEPRLWTLQRALVAVALLGGCILLGLAWIGALRRRVRAQTRQLREQLERQARLEAEVQRAARLESLGVLAGGIAHDFNNLLTIVVGNLGLAALDPRLEAETKHYLRQIQEGVTRARGLTQQLLTFAKGGDPLRSNVALPEIVKTAVDLALHGSGVRSEHAVAPDLWAANVDKDQIAQAVQNIVLNAVQAMPRGGQLRVRLANDPIAGGAKAALAPGRYVKVSIADSGEGIGADVLPRIFDPYFSTRRTGSGLGLATVYSIVKKHGGSIEAESQPGTGTTFHLWLPAAREVPPEPPRGASGQPFPAVAAASRAPRVLVMDDESSIREVLGIVLKRMGIEGTVVADGRAALQEFSVAQRTGRPFDLLILDLTVPGGMGGREAIELIRKLDANVPAIVSSGYSSDPVMANYASYGFQASVPKPYELGQLVKTINRLLGRE